MAGGSWGGSREGSWLVLGRELGLEGGSWGGREETCREFCPGAKSARHWSCWSYLGETKLQGKKVLRKYRRGLKVIWP